MSSLQQVTVRSQEQSAGGVASMLAQVPTPLGGLALGIASLGGAWPLISPDSGAVLKVVTALIAVVLLLNILLKFAFHPYLVRQELAHPVIGSVMPTCAMATMVIASSLLPYLGGFARALWLIAVCCHMLLFTGFAYHRIREFQLEHMVPSWFVPPVGIIVAAVTSSGMGYYSLVYGLFIFGLVCYFVKLPAMLYRLIFRAAIPSAALPTFAIMAAPASLSLAGYLTISLHPDPLLILILAPLAIFMTCLVYLAFIRLLRLPFSPGYAAFTFPMVIGATAQIKLTFWLQGQDLLWLSGIVDRLARLELIIATVMVIYVAMRYGVFYLIRPLSELGR